MLEDCSPFLIVTIVAISYFLGAIPSGYLIGKLKGVDIRKQGSGNIGATNAFRILGAKAASVVLLADAFKGFLSCLLLHGHIYKLQLLPVSNRFLRYGLLNRLNF